MEELIQSDLIEWKAISLKRGDFIIRPGKIEKYIYWVKSGALRAFLIKDEEEFTIRFGYTDSIITAIPSYFSQLPTELYIQAIRKSELLRCSKQQFDQFINSDLELLRKYQTILEELINSFYEREIDLLTQSPKERIGRLRARSPQVFQEIPHKYIASYLRMSPETLSRLLKS